MKTRITGACLVAAMALSTPPSWAQSSFTVDPLLVTLGGQNATAVMTLTNPGSRPLRFEIKGFSWNQSVPDGTMELTPSTDIVIFPPLVTVNPKMTQRIRIGSSVPQGASEKSYRIMIEELPSELAPGAGAQVAVRTKVGVPVFIQSTSPSLRGTIDSVRVANRVVSIAFTNGGTTHALLDDVLVRGMAAPDQMTFEEALQGWYILAGKTRVWRYPLKPAQCKTTKFIEIELLVNDAMLTARADVPPSACAP